MFSVIDIRHFLDERGELPIHSAALRRRALRFAQLIEAGGPLAIGQLRETLVACVERPNRKACLGRLWVEKATDGRIYAGCPRCHREEILIAGWEGTPWATGPMAPASAGVSAPMVDVN